MLRPFLNMSALFLTNMVSDSGANVGPCWNSQLLQRISTNIQESATNKINIITRERERKREIEKKKEKTIFSVLQMYRGTYNMESVLLKT